MSRATLSELINQINNVIKENTSGNITATNLNQLLDYLTNNLYLPTESTVIVNTKDGIKEFDFGSGLTATIDEASGKVAVTAVDNTPLIAYGEMNITTKEDNKLTYGAGKATASDTLLPITVDSTYFQVPGYEAGTQDGLAFDSANGGLRATIAGTYYFDHWISCRHNADSATVGIVLGIKRGDSVVSTSLRPVPTMIPANGTLGLISGTTLLDLQVNDVVVVLAATDKEGDVTFNNSSIIGKLLKAS